MKKVMFVVFLLCLCLPIEAIAARGGRVGAFAACSTTYTLPHSSFIYKNSAPLRGSSGAIIGFRREPTLIMKTRFSGGSTTVYASNGVKIGSCPKTSAHGFAGGRMRCTMQTASLRRSAVSASGSPAALFTLGGGKCAKVPDAGRCYGSVKGLCNQILR